MFGMFGASAGFELEQKDLNVKQNCPSIKAIGAFSIILDLVGLQRNVLKQFLFTWKLHRAIKIKKEQQKEKTDKSRDKPWVKSIRWVLSLLEMGPCSLFRTVSATKWYTEILQIIRSSAMLSGDDQWRKCWGPIEWCSEADEDFCHSQTCLKNK